VIKRQSERMKLLASLLVLCSATAFADVTVMDNDKTVAVDCVKDKNVTLIGNNITANLTGTCESVKVTGNHETVNGSMTNAFVAGNHNTLALDGVDNISVAGSHNTITHKKPLAKKKTNVSNLGKGNTITQTK
jgi:Protein of unknown function (DUF3060)